MTSMEVSFIPNLYIYNKQVFRHSKAYYADLIMVVESTFFGMTLFEKLGNSRILINAHVT